MVFALYLGFIAGVPKRGQPSVQRQQEHGKLGACPALLAQGFISPFCPDGFSGRWLTSGKPWGKVTQPRPWLMPGEGPLLIPSLPHIF